MGNYIFHTQWLEKILRLLLLSLKAKVSAVSTLPTRKLLKDGVF